MTKYNYELKQQGNGMKAATKQHEISERTSRKGGGKATGKQQGEQQVSEAKPAM